MIALIVFHRADLHANATITEEIASSVEHGLPTNEIGLLASFWSIAREFEVEEGFSGRNLAAQYRLFLRIPAGAKKCVCRLGSGVDCYAEYLGNGTGYFGEAAGSVLLPVPVRY